MLKNYLKIAFRSFSKQKLTSAINIIGLSLGIACAGLGYLFIQYERSYDRFHDEAENIYWLSVGIENKIHISASPLALGPALQAGFPEVTEALRMENHEILIQSGNEFFKEKAHFVDPNFFTFFSFELLTGHPEQVLVQPNGLVISERMAKKYFGRLDPVGKELKVNYLGQEAVLEISGIAANAPQNSSLQFDFLLPLPHLYQGQPEQLASWERLPATSFIRFRPGSDISRFREGLSDFAARQVPAEAFGGDRLVFYLRALQDYHLKDQYMANALTPPADMTYVRMMGIIAALILLVACLNFMNLANAQGSGRLLEVGVRRVLGAGRRQLAGQFLTEAIFTSLLSLGVGIAFIQFSLPYISQITGFLLEINWASPAVVLPLLGIALATGLLAGIYPSWLLSRLEAVQTFKSEFKTGGNNLVTKGSLVFQFALSIGLLSCTFIMYQQQQFIRDRHLGFNQEETLVIPTQLAPHEAEPSQQLVSRLKTEWLQYPDIVQASGVSYSFDRGNAALFVQEDDGSQELVYFYHIDADYIPLLDIELIRGRNFSAEATAAQDKTVIVNEAFLKQFEISDPENYQLPEKFDELADARIIGVVKDYNYLNLKSGVKPMILRQKPDAYLGYILVKVRPEAVDRTIAQLKESWKKVAPSKPFEFSFLDEDIQRQYLTEERWNKAISGAALLAIFIACLGLFGLIALILTERTKEIGIRKILGASVGEISWLISRQFVILMGIAALFAIPAAWWAMQQWLHHFAYKIDIQVFIFMAALGITLLIALLTMGLQSARAALRNPVEALRHE